MDGAATSYRRGSFIGGNVLGDRRASTAYDTSNGIGSMGPPSSTTRSAAFSGMQTLQESSSEHHNHHPPSKSATGGQSHSHRPVSVMPTTTTRSQAASSRQHMEPSTTVSSAMGSASSYADRRASAHPTMTTSATYQGSMSPAIPQVPALDAATAGAISNGIPATSAAALQYFAAHPRRQQVHFGNYLLLQTLGEGEFGKVKLGVHKEWGEEVAVKLIKREKVGTADGHLQINGPSKDPSKMSKVEKEIRVLKDVRHPNIVRLYEVIESDRYIGIVLEYASGGELFDHILAHKYLKEKDACRLFAQLISGVSYLHSKKIVHRDLKLENLLLDRNRNVIITDFGFANNFENKKDDLMATSCGSPCYAAPELVVQDGLYAGSAVDVWSCGVILYAMLAGYLPYDDDPKNPEGDNINLLYKYIMATPLSFPDYIPAEPRDLLCKMLVPDPLKRADLETVMSHSWLAPYRDLFRFSVEDLERAAMEQQNKKRMVYRQQMMQQQQQLAEQQQQQQQQQGGAGGKSNRSNNGVSENMSVKQSRHQSAMPTSSTTSDRLYDNASNTFAAPKASTGRSRPVTLLPTPIITVPEASIAEEREVSSPLSPRSPITPSSPSRRRSSASKSNRHSVQADSDAKPLSPLISEVPPVPRLPKQGEEEAIESNDSSRTAIINAVPIVVPISERKTSINATQNLSSNDKSKMNPMTIRTTSNPLPSLPSPSISPTSRIASGGPGPRPDAAGRGENSPSEEVPTTMSFSRSDQGTKTTSQEKRASRHLKGLSTDKSFFSKVKAANFPGSADVSPFSTPKSETPGTIEETPELGRRSSNRRKAMSLVVGRYLEQTPAKNKDAGSKTPKEERRMSARLRKDTLTKESTSPVSSPAERMNPFAAAARVTSAEQNQRSPSTASVLNNSVSSRTTGKTTPFEQRFNESDSTVGPSGNAAKKVMDWFRKKSVAKGAYDDNNKMPQGANEASDSPATSPTQEMNLRVIVTNDAGKDQDKTEMLLSSAGLESVPSSRSTSGTHSQNSQLTDGASVQTTPTEASILGEAGTAGNKTSSSGSTVQQQPTPPKPSLPIGRMTRSARVKVDDSALRVHQGAVDQSALTSKSPNEVLLQVQRALFEMGIEAKKEREEEYKFECVRRKKTKTLIGTTQGIGASIRTSVFPPSQAELEKSTARGPPSPGGNGSPAGGQLSASQSSTSGLKNLLAGRRISVQPAANQPAPSSSTDGMPSPLYGEASVDGGQEIRFSVEITKIKNLPGLYSLDIRRMKGNIWSFKHVYYALLQRCELNSSDI